MALGRVKSRSICPVHGSQDNTHRAEADTELGKQPRVNRRHSEEMRCGGRLLGGLPSACFRWLPRDDGTFTKNAKGNEGHDELNQYSAADIVF